jgi:N-acetyl-anhydromuramyl-L-alanine amidase AmpD
VTILLLRRLHFACLLLLCGCSSLPPQLSWFSDSGQNDDSGLIEQFEDRNQVEGNPTRPPLMNLGDGRVQAANPSQIQECEALLQLPEEEPQPAHPTNFGERKTKDSWGRELQVKPMVIVLHETVISEAQTVDLFQTNHPEDNQQVSYHMLIARDGRRIRVVPDEKRAYGSGMSAFGDVTMRTRPGAVGSINNIALHISLITPPDGRGDVHAHSGYSAAQYRSLAEQVLLWQAKFGIPITRLTTHAAVDRSRSRYDPRSFRWDRFDPYYQHAAKICAFDQYDNQQAGP